MSNSLIGRMRSRVSLKKESDLPSNAFSNTTTYKQVKDVWGELVSVSGRSYYTVRNLLDTTSHTLTIRFDASLSNTGKVDHVVYCGRMFKISTSQIFDERNRFIIFQLEEMGQESSYVS
tara:strand:+ start:2940 stop:3296 length:357 start_codon:yes stop_codon:yes gene_type:complete